MNLKGFERWNDKLLVSCIIEWSHSLYSALKNERHVFMRKFYLQSSYRQRSLICMTFTKKQIFFFFNSVLIMIYTITMIITTFDNFNIYWARRFADISACESPPCVTYCCKIVVDRPDLFFDRAFLTLSRTRWWFHF